MSLLNYRNNILYFEDVSLNEIADKIVTPMYIYSQSTLENNFNKINEALNKILGKEQEKLIAFSVKSNSNIAIINRLHNLGSGADVVSVGELKRSLNAGIKGNKIVFSGVGKTSEEMLFALEMDVVQFNIESISEINQLSEIASSNNKIAPIAFRINPDIVAGGHEKIATGGSNTKFGIPYSEALKAYEYAKSLPGINIVGIDIHIGSQITNLEPFSLAFQKIRDLYDKLIIGGHNIINIDLGGGIGIKYLDTDEPFLLEDYANLVNKNFGDLKCKLIFEPGRCIAASAGILLTKVIRDKNSYNNNFLVVDAAMNDFMRPALYGAKHKILSVNKDNNSDKKINYQVVGPVCETGDVMGEIVSSRIMNSGDYIIIKDVGAYGAVMSSNYNSRPSVPEVLIKDSNFSVIRKAITTEELLAFESIPSE